MNGHIKSLLIILTISFACSAFGQAYFKGSSAMDLLDQKTAQFSNGDLLIGNSSTAALRSGDESGVLILTRIDQCGTVKWVKEYKYDDGYLVLSDIAVNQEDEIFMFGRNNSQLTESIFVAKLGDPALGNLDLKIYNPGSVDNFTFSMDIDNDRLLIYGLLFDFNTSKEGFIGLFDHDLNFVQGSKFIPFESSGNAMFSSDGGIVGRSGPFVYKFDSDNDIQWAFKTVGQQELQNIAGPIESGNGWIFESHNSGKSFLYKLDVNGILKWKSQSIEKSNNGGDLIQWADDRILFTYNSEINGGTALSFFGMDNLSLPLFHRTLTHSFSMNTGMIKQEINNEYLTVIGSKSVSANGTKDIENFILQFNLDELNYDCFSLEPALINDNNMFDLETLTFESLDFNAEELTLDLINRIKIKATEGLINITDLCLIDGEIMPRRESKLIPCVDTWEVSLPSEDFQWDDGYREIDRSLSIPGIYSARSVDCENQEIIEYTLEKDECDCDIYLPNIFTPNNDNTNDELEIGIFCDVESINFSIFNRWGQRIFSSNNIDVSWSGKMNQKDAPAGVYTAILDYKWKDTSGEIQEEKILQTITLLR